MPRSRPADLYRSEAGRTAVERWCRDRLAAWPVPHEAFVVETTFGPTHVVAAGGAGPSAVVLPGTNFNGATSLALLGALASRCRAYGVDPPGQPGLSTDRRPPEEDPAAHRRWVSSLLRALPRDPASPVVLVAHSRGAYSALCSDPGEVDALVLLHPAGLVKVAVTGRVLRRAVPWVLRPTRRRSAALLRLMTGGGTEPDPALVTWLLLVASCSRSTGAPGPLPRAATDRWRGRPVAVLTGERDCFFPPDRLGAELETLPGVGHLGPEEATSAVADRVLDVVRRLS